MISSKHDGLTKSGACHKRLVKPDKYRAVVEKKIGTTTEHNSLDIPLGYLLLFIAATLVAAVTVQFIPDLAKLFSLVNQTVNPNETYKWHKPTYAIFQKGVSDEHLVHVKTLLHKFGFQRVGVDADWDLLWAHDYPYGTIQRLKNLGAHQFVNHIPGCGYLTNKVDLCTTRLPFLPRAFRLPAQIKEFLLYAHAHPKALFVQKHNEHRQIQIRAVEYLVSALNFNDSFVQEFIQRPFLVDGHKFDIGVYVVITSINPLRAYMYTGDVLFRYCPIKYNPFDPEDLDKYIVGDNYLPSWEVPALRKYYNHFECSMRSAFEAYVRDQSMNPSTIWSQVEHILRTTILAKEQNIIDILQVYKTHNFFELVRFDLFIDEDLKVHLMEINMSPNLSSAHFKPNSLLYEQLLYSVFNLVGIRPVVINENSNFVSIDNGAKEMITADKNLATGLNQCVSNKCDKMCNKPECSLCLPCLSGTEYKFLQMAHKEHLHRVDMKRIFPKPIYDYEAFDIASEIRNLSKKNVWITRWFYNKCEFDRTWCI